MEKILFIDIFYDSYIGLLIEICLTVENYDDIISFVERIISSVGRAPDS